MGSDLVKMSSKGQLVVPQDIREKHGFAPGDRFVAVEAGDGVYFKPVDIPELEKFEAVSERLSQHFEEHGLTEEDIAEAVEWAKKQRS